LSGKIVPDNQDVEQFINWWFAGASKAGIEIRR